MCVIASESVISDRLVYRSFFGPVPGAVFCVCIDPRTSQLVASGGEDDKAYVWKASDGEVLMECTGKVGMFADDFRIGSYRLLVHLCLDCNMQGI